MNTAVEAGSRSLLLADQSCEEQVRSLVQHAQEFIYQYYETEAPWSGPAWWLTFNQTGDCLRDALEETHVRRCSLQLSDQEVERAYTILIQVAYFFEPGGVAECFFQEQGWVKEETAADGASAPLPGNSLSLRSIWYMCLRVVSQTRWVAFCLAYKRWRLVFAHVLFLSPRVSAGKSGRHDWQN